MNSFNLTCFSSDWNVGKLHALTFMINVASQCLGEAWREQLFHFYNQEKISKKIDKESFHSATQSERKFRL